jgi:4-carboxymuconolactone decarboxylase
MQLEQREKELAAIGAAVGCNCRPCVEHHIPAGRAAGLSEPELADAVATARGVRNEAIRLLAPRIDELLTGYNRDFKADVAVETSRTHALVALGASIGANSHPLLYAQIAAALELGLTHAEITAAVRTAEYVQQRASEMTAEKVKHALDELAGDADPVGASDVSTTLNHDRKASGGLAQTPRR